MIDDIEYALPLGWLGALFGGAFTRAKLQRMFDYRHQVVAKQFSKLDFIHSPEAKSPDFARS